VAAATQSPTKVIISDHPSRSRGLEALKDAFWAKDVKVGCTAVTIERSINAAEQPAIVAARQSRSVASAGRRSLFDLEI
jgi:hypothetical protein